MKTTESPLIAIVIPCYNDNLTIGLFLLKAQKALSALAIQESIRFVLVIIDDGSRTPLADDDCGEWAHQEQTPLVSGVLLKHLINLGQGAALRTGISYALSSLNAEYFVTMDSDGQHRLEDLMNVLRPVIRGQADIVFGNRFAGQVSDQMPASRKTILRFAAVFEKIITGLPLNDAHNGYRAFNRKVALDLRIRQNRMAHATEIKQIIARKGHRYHEVPVSIDYSADTLAKGQSNMGSFVILKDLAKAYLFNE